MDRDTEEYSSRMLFCWFKFRNDAGNDIEMQLGVTWFDLIFDYIKDVQFFVQWKLCSESKFSHIDNHSATEEIDFKKLEQNTIFIVSAVRADHSGYVATISARN